MYVQSAAEYCPFGWVLAILDELGCSPLWPFKVTGVFFIGDIADQPTLKGFLIQHFHWLLLLQRRANPTANSIC